MKLIAGRTYINRFDYRVKIIKRHETDLCHFYGDDGLEYGIAGVCLGKGRNWDLDYSDDKIDKMLHALGVSHSQNGEQLEPNRRYCPYPTSYRNFYQINNCPEWNGLVELGYAVKAKGNADLNYYFVTDNGKDYLKSLGFKWHK